MKKEKWLLIIGIICIACNLRAAITAVGALTLVIRDDLGLSNGLAGTLTTVPLIAFALFSPFVPRLTQRFGAGRVLLAGLVLMLAGEVVRSSDGTAGLFAGTLLLGLGIATGNVLVPVVIKQQFPTRIGLLTGVHTTCMAIFAGLAAGVSIPLAVGAGLGWRFALGIWAVLTIVATLIWLPQAGTRKKEMQPRKQDMGSIRAMYRSPLAWQVTLFMGLQSLLFYSLVAWLPAIVQGFGFSAAIAGNMALLYQLISLPASFFVPLLVDRFRDQRAIALLGTSVYLCGMIAIFCGSRLGLLVLGVSLCGLGGGACISLAMAFFGLRTESAQLASQLSGTAQSLGYLLAAAGPLCLGLIYDHTGSWTIPLGLLIVVVACLLLCGFGAGRDATLQTETDSRCKINVGKKG